MKKNVFAIFLLAAAAIFLSSCDAALDPYITGAEFDGEDYKTVLVSYDSKFGDHTVSAVVYGKSGKIDSVNSIKKQSYTSSSGKTTVVLYEEVPVGGKIVIEPALGNTELSGSAEISRN